MTKHASLYHKCLGQWVYVATSANTYIGKMESDDHELIVLRPSIIGEAKLRPNDGLIQRIEYSRVEEETPTIVDTQRVEGIRPASEKYFREYCQTSQDLAKKLLERN